MQNYKYIDLIKKKPMQIGFWLGFTDLTELHNEWMKEFMFTKEDKTLLAHRGSYKTTCLSIAISLMMIIFPNKNIFFIRKTDTDTTEIINQISKILKSENIQYLVNMIYGTKLILTEDNNSSITTNLYTSARGTAQLFSMGIKGSLTGKHFDIIITDDIVNLKDRSSRAEREFTKSIYMELENIKNRGGRILNTGTPWHKDDCISIMPNVTKYDCYETDLIDSETLRDIRSKMTASLFAANYELKHIASEDVLFDSPQFFSEANKLYNGIGHIDASYGGDDRTAYTIAKKCGNDFFIFGKLWKKHVDDCVAEMLTLQDRYKAGSIYCETNGDKGYLAKSLQMQGRKVYKYHENMNKFVKISTYVKSHWGNIYFLDGTDAEYIDEICDYNEQAAHDDAPDSLASILREIDKPKGGIRF